MRDLDASLPLLATFPATLPASMDFAALLDEGIRHAQRMSHDNWTDYNEHDPGLTILEQLCYALTDLGMRGHYPVADLLADPHGRVQRGALFSGARILPGAPQTAADYRRLLLGRVEGIKNFWLTPGPVAGLYDGCIEVADPAMSDRVRFDAAHLLRANRALGDDMASLIVMQQQRVLVEGVVIVASGHDADAVMATILVVLNRDLLPALPADVVPTTIDLARIVLLVRACGGVQSLEAPRFATSDALQLPLRQGALPYFAVPTVDGRWPFVLRDIRGGAIEPDPQRVLRFMARATAASTAAHRVAARAPEEKAHRHRPTGQWRDIGHYHSLQHQFPVTYGLSHYGVPANLAGQGGGNRVQRLAQARQLCAYLLLFEQMLANGFSQLAAARTLFAVRPAQRHSYASQPLVGRAPRPRDAPLVRSVLPDADAPAPAPSPRPGAGQYRYLVEVLIDRPGRPRARDVAAVLFGARTADRAAAGRVRQNVILRGVDAGNYAVMYEEGGACTLTLMAADGTPLAHGDHRYRNWDQASVAAVVLARQLRQAQERGVLGRHVVVRRQPALGMRVFRHFQLVLSAWWQALLPDRDRLVDRVLRLGCDVANYRLRRDGDGWRCDLYDDARRVARGHLRGASREEAWRLCEDVAALLLRIGHTGPEWVRHVELLPNDALARLELPSQLPPDAPSLPGQYAQHHYQTRMQAIVARYDDFPARRHAFLDHLLARFDTGFDDAVLASVDPRPANRTGFLAELAGWKSSMLAALPHAAARRGSGRDVARRLVHEMPFGAGLEHHLFSLLGIGGRHDFARYPLSRPRLARQRPWYDGGAPDAAAPSFVFWDLREDLMAMLLEYGTDLRRYVIRPARPNRPARLYFIHPNGKWRRVLAHRDGAALAWARDRLIAALLPGGPLWRELYAGEGLYVVEHILLRPGNGGVVGGDTFYPLRITVLFPAWPLRFRNVHLRALAESLLAQHVPAHLGWDCYWLAFDQMRAFEDLYARWSAFPPGGAHGQRDASALALRHFIEQLAPEGQA